MDTIDEHLEDLDYDIKKLENRIAKCELANASRDNLTTLIAELGMSLGDILQEIENLHEEFIDISKKYVPYLEQDQQQ